MLLGLWRADSGAVRLLGGDPWRDAVQLHRRIAYVPGDVTLWPNLTGLQAIDFLARLRGSLARLALRRDPVRLSVWLAVLTSLMVYAQMSALLMAIFLRGMSGAEIARWNE